MSIIFLTPDEVKKLHDQQIEERGGKPGLRDAGLLESAVASIEQGYEDNLFEIAASYGYSISQNQAFYKGNKRTAVMAMGTFLYMNGYILEWEWAEAYEILIKMSQKTAGKAELAALLRDRSKKNPLSVLA